MRTARNPIPALLLAVCLAAPSAAGATAFSPYVDMAGYPPPPLAKWRAASGVERITLGFVTARGGTDCAPTWGGYADYEMGYRAKDVRAFRGTATISFGGQAGTELASVCPSARALAAAYRTALNAYGVRRADFDIEGAALQDTAAAARRRAAIRRLHGIRVGYTLPVMPSGLDAASRRLVTPGATVNVMAMDYGAGLDGDMGAYAIRAVTATHRRLGLPFRRLSVTPMIGINDVPSEVFTLSDARQLRRWARRHRLGGLGMWEMGRDAACPEPVTTARLTCSGVAQKRWAFSRALR